MYKILITAAVTVVLVVFGTQNSDHVPVSFIVGAPTKVRLIFLLALAASCGFLISYVRGLAKEIQMKKELRRLNATHSSTVASLAATVGWLTAGPARAQAPP